jgi:hypothetical protein
MFMASRLPLSPFLPILLAGCAATPPDPNVARTPACDQNVRCFYQRGIRSFRVLDNRTVVVLVGRDQCPFKLELDGFFCDLNMASFLSFNDDDGRVCRWDRTIVGTGPFSRADEYCRVSQVTPMTDDELLEEYATSGMVPPLPARGSGELEVVGEDPSEEELVVPEAAGGAGKTMPGTEPAS